MTAKNDLSFQSLEKVIWIIDKLERYRKFSVIEFGEKFYGSKFKTRDLVPFITKIISSDYLGLKNLIPPYIEKNDLIDEDGKKVENVKGLDRRGFFTLQENAIIENIRFSDSDVLIEAIIKKMSQTPYINPLFTPISIENLQSKINCSQSSTDKNSMNAKADSRFISSRIVYHFSEYEKIGDKFKSSLNRILNSFPQNIAHPETKVIEFIYKKLDGEMKKETILPLRLVNYQGKWYVLGLYINSKDKKYDLDKVMQFRVSRMEEIKQVNTHFAVPNEDEIKLDSLLSSNFGIGIGQSHQSKAKIKFTGDVAKMISEIQWHPEQTLTKEADGSIIMTIKYPINLSRELFGRVLRYGRYAQILEPDDLRKEWKEEIMEMSKLQ